MKRLYKVFLMLLMFPWFFFVQGQQPVVAPPLDENPPPKYSGEAPSEFNNTLPKHLDAVIDTIPTPASQANSETTQINQITFLDVYFNILETSCARSQCHDGNFEPNMTSPQAAYNTMVIHEIIKNSPSEEFEFRVVPFEPEQSLLLERLTNCCMIDGNDRMPLLMGSLSDPEIDLIRIWILGGCLDPYGEYPYKIE